MKIDSPLRGTWEMRPVFVVGMNGSGTTLLLDCLNHHPRLYGFRKESRVIPYYIASVEKYKDLNNDNSLTGRVFEFTDIWHNLKRENKDLVIQYMQALCILAQDYFVALYC